MEEQHSSACSASSSSSTMEKEHQLELECVGQMVVKKSSGGVYGDGFICGTLPVPVLTHSDPFCNNDNNNNYDALVPHLYPPLRAPRYKMLPTETDLNMPPSVKFVSSTSTPDFSGVYAGCGSGHFAQPLARKCEALAVRGLAEYGDEIDVVAPADILKQIFKIPYSKARISVAVHRIGRTLILNTGPDVEEAEQLTRKKNKSKGIDPSLFLNFAMHSVRAEACDCPPSSKTQNPEKSAHPTVIPAHTTTEYREEECLPSINQRSHSWKFVNTDELDDPGDTVNSQSQGCSQKRRDRVTLSGRKSGGCKSRIEALKKANHVCEKHSSQNRCKDSEKHRLLGNEGFLRVLFWQFHNFRMLLGSDLLVFSNDKHVAVSLHLWEVERQVTPSMWLDAWLDSTMASVPELAICYHHNGVVQGYELLKTDDILLLKGISEDGTTIFHPQVVRQHGLSVLKFLQENCKEDPGSYWLYKNAGEDLVQLFDLSVISKNCPDTDDEGCSSLPSSKSRRKRNYSLPLGILLYRLAHRLSLSKVPNDMSKCAKLFKKCLEFQNGQELLLVRACAHEQVARLILKCYEDFGSTIKTLLLECDPLNSNVKNVIEEVKGLSMEDSSTDRTLAGTDLISTESSEAGALEQGASSFVTSDGTFALFHVEETASKFVKTVNDPISVKMAAVHHVSQAIKSLRWKRQLQDSDSDSDINVLDGNHKASGSSFHAQNFLVCVCGDVDCIEVCDIHEWLAGYRMDRKLWQLVLLLGESYLALGQAYKDSGQLTQAVKAVELSCTVYGSLPSSLEDIDYVSAVEGTNARMPSSFHGQVKSRRKQDRCLHGDASNGYKLTSGKNESDCHIIRKGLFWGRAYILVGDIYVEWQRVQGEMDPVVSEEKCSEDELKMASEVMKEVKRLKKKLGQGKHNCIICSDTRCSCQSDRASSGNSASSSRNDEFPLVYKRKKNKRETAQLIVTSHAGNLQSDLDSTNCKGDSQKCRGLVKHIDVASDVAIGRNETKEILEDSVAEAVTSKASSGDLNVSKSLEVEAHATYRDIFDFIEGLKCRDRRVNLIEAGDCYDAARDALRELTVGVEEFQSATRKKGWVFNELGRQKLVNTDLESAETFFATAISAFREVQDITNIVLINCNLGHGRRAVAESLAAKIDSFKQFGLNQSAYKETLDEVKFQYGQALNYYCAAQSELNDVGQSSDLAVDGLWDEANTQLAHTYLRLGMVLVREEDSANLVMNVSCDRMPIELTILNAGIKETSYQKRIELSGSEAIREALSLYKSLGTLRLQEAAFANFQLACCHRDSCLKALNKGKDIMLESSQNANLQQAKRYASLAERYWQKAIDFYGAGTHADMFLQILMERSALCQALSSYCSSNMMLESALSHMLEGRHLCCSIKNKSEQLTSDFGSNKVVERFCKQLQSLLKTMLAAASHTGKHLGRLGSSQSKKKDGTSLHQNDLKGTTGSAGDVVKLRELYRIALKSEGLPDLLAMQKLWES